MDGVFGICTQIHGKVQAVCVDRVRIAQNLCIFLYQFILIYIYICNLKYIHTGRTKNTGLFEKRKNRKKFKNKLQINFIGTV